MASNQYSASNHRNLKSKSMSNIHADHHGNGSPQLMSSSVSDVREAQEHGQNYQKEKVASPWASQIVDLLRRRIVYKSGGQDKRGRSIISIDIQKADTLHDIATCILYLTSNTRKRNHEKPFVIVADFTGLGFQQVRSILDMLQKSCRHQIHTAYLVVPGAFKGKDGERWKYNFSFETILFSTLSKLFEVIDTHNLTEDFGGTLLYNHDEWVELRLDYERFLKDASTLIQRLDRVNYEVKRQDKKTMGKKTRSRQRWHDVVFNQPGATYQHGTYIIRKLRKDKSEDETIMLNEVEGMLNEIQDKQGELKHYLSEDKKEHHVPMEVQELESGIKRVVDWIIGPGEKLLASQSTIGNNLQSADQLRRDHEKLELKCTETYATFAELRYVANGLIKNGGPSTESVAAQKKYMDSVCRSFASRLEKRRNLLICSVCFHRTLENSMHTLEDLIEMFRGDVVADSTEMVKRVVSNIDDNCHAIAFSIEQTEREGERLLEMMSSPVKNAFGKDITPKFDSQKSHVTTSIHEMNKQRKQVNELADLWKLKLQQILQLRTCEEDSVQGIVWLEELCDVVTRSHADIGSTTVEADQRKKSHASLEATAEKTYDYSKQLLSAGLAIRRSLEYDTAPNDSLAHRLHLAWKSFAKESEERASRLSVSLMFNNNAEMLGQEMDKFSTVVRESFNDTNFSERDLHYHRNRQSSIQNRYVDTIAMGKALLDRIAAPSSSPYRLVSPPEPAGQVFSQDDTLINQKLLELKIKKLEMDLLLSRPEEAESILRHIKDLSAYQISGPNAKDTSSILESDLNKVSPASWKDAKGMVSPFTNSEPQQVVPATWKDAQGMVSPYTKPNHSMTSTFQDGPEKASSPMSDNYASYNDSMKGEPLVQEPIFAKTEVQNTAAAMNNIRFGDSSPEEQAAMRILKEFEAEIDESTEWVRVKVHEMTPRMTDVGQNKEEALHLKAQHNKLVEQIASRQQQINALLTQGDNLVSTQQFYNDVYEAMAQSLGEAWQDLNKQLQDRRNLLDEAINFYQLSEDFSDKLKRASDESRSQEMPVNVVDSEARLKNHHDLKKDILATSMKAMNLGRTLIQKLNNMTPVDSPVEDRHATTTACYAIERTLESLQDRRRGLEDAWNKRRLDLEQNIVLCNLNQEVDEVSDWFKSYGEVHFDVGDSIEATRTRLKDHERLQESFKEVQTKVSNMHVEAVKVSPSTQHKLQLLLTQTRGVNTLCDDFAEKLNNWHQILTCTLDFMVHTQMAMETLYKVEVEIQNINQEDRPKYLSTIHHAIDPVVQEGQVLLSMLTYPTPGASHIQITIDKLQMEGDRLDNQCLDDCVHENSVTADFEERYSVLVRWLRNVGDNYLATYNDPGDQLTTAMDFLEGHEQLDDDMREKTKEVEKVLSATADIIRSGAPDSSSVQERADKLRQQWSRITISVENRIRIALILVKFHKLTKELVNAMENLETHLKIAINSETLPQKTSNLELQERWNHVIELYVQTESKGKNYLSEANFVRDDPLIVLQPSISTVELKLQTYEEHKNKLTDMLDSWQLNQTLSKDFASQWKQFVADARQTIRWVERVEADFFPMSGELDGALHDTDSLQTKFDEIQLTMQRINAEIELRLKTAEMLALKGDTKGEKDAIVEELLAVHEGLQGRIIELQILLTVSKSFFDNMRKVLTLMNTTERSFKTAELPRNQTQKSVLVKRHEKCREEIMTLYDSTAARANEVIQRLQQSEKHSGSIQEVEDAMKGVDDCKLQWLVKWREHRDRLESSHQETQISKEKIQLMRDLGMVELELKAIENDYGDSIHSVTLIVEKCEDILVNLEPLERRCKTFISSAHLCMRQTPSRAGEYSQDIDEVNMYLSTLHRQIDEKKRRLEIAVDVYETYELAVKWYNDGNKLLVEVAGDSQNVKKSEDANQLLDKVADFLEEGQCMQESRLDKINLLTKQLYEKPPAFVSELTYQNREMLKAFNEINDEVFVIVEKLQESEYKMKQVEMEQLMTIEEPSSKHPVVQDKPVAEETLAEFVSHSESSPSVREKFTAPYGTQVVEEQLQRKFVEEDNALKEIRWPEKRDELDIGVTEITKTEVEFVPARVREEPLEQAVIQLPVEAVQFDNIFRPITMQDAEETFEETLETTTDVSETEPDSH
ncbi:triple functional domain protein-like [Antedon mediterranea]|uniref:triple functional domain protein-like n=1 Tax=Antedon mediterranea TaxID=105859 RepID=UPI003AF69918